LDSTSTRKLGFFFSDHHRWLLQHIHKRLRNHADAEDTAAEAFCQMLGARVDPDSIQQPRAYLTAIAVASSSRPTWNTWRGCRRP
jgi:DNA-directed RNA polymerase specialized sigma24 family protein